MADNVDDTSLASLPPVYRVALGSARPQESHVFAALFALDARLGRAVREASEPIIAQMKLAWWRDRFAQAPDEWPAGEPLLARLEQWGSAATQLGALVDGWEEVVTGEELDAQGAERFARGRAASWDALASVVGVSPDDGAFAASAVQFTWGDLWDRGFELPLNSVSIDQPVRLPRSLRPFAVLGNLGRRAASKKRPMLDGLPSLALAVRTGLIGR